MSYDFQALKLIPIASVLRHYGIEVKKRNDKELVCACALPSHKEAEHKNNNLTFCIGVEKNKWYCQSDTCRAIGNHPKGGDVLDLVCRLDQCDVKTAAKKLSELFAINQNPPHGATGLNATPRTLGTRDTTNDTSIAVIRNPPLAFILKNLDPDHPFLKGKGISIETAMEFGVGVHSGKGSMSNRVCFPIHEDGQLVAYIGRSVDDSEPKWKIPAGLVRSFVFGIERCDPAKELILCESMWAVLWFHQCGLQAAALVACTMTEEQEKRLAPFNAIVLAMDNDAAGRDACQKLYDRLKPGRKVRKAFIND